MNVKIHLLMGVHTTQRHLKTQHVLRLYLFALKKFSKVQTCI